MTQAEVDVAAVAGQVVDAVRNDHAGGPTGEVVVERAEGPLRPHATLAIELSEVLLGLGIQGKHGIARVEVLALQFRNALELRLAIGRPPPASTFAILCNAKPSSSSQSRTTRGLTGVPKLATCSAS